LSGIAGISYELVWSRYLIHLFGASTPAVSGTVSIFFAGLALGAALFGRLFDRLRRPLRAYGLLELCIGLTAALVPKMVTLIERRLIDLGSAGETWLIRLVLAACVLLVPATLLGATFPAMAAAARRMKDPTRRTSLFYGFNTIGAVLGCLITGFWLIPALGLLLTTTFMLFINVIVGLMALLLGTMREKPLPEIEAGSSSEDRSKASSPGKSSKGGAPLGLKTASILAIGSGLFAIGIEVLWVRTLALSFPATVYVFSVVLTAYLIGIGSGSLLLNRLRRALKNEIHLLGSLYFWIALSCLGAMIVFPHLGEWGLGLLKGEVLKSWGAHIASIGGMALLTMLPATLAMGASLPLLIGLSDIPRRESRTAGRLYGLNTFGGIVGSLLATFGLMPWLGLSKALLLLGSGYLALVAFLGFTITREPSKRIILVIPLLLVTLMNILGIVPEVNGGRERPGSVILFYHDAPSGTVAVYEKEQNIRNLRVNNHYGLSETSPSTVRMQRRLGHLPMLIHPSPRRALLIGLATGTTLSAMSEYPLQQLDCVELHPTVIQTISYFEEANRGVWRQPVVQIHAGDGRRFLRQDGPGYDVIVGDLYLPRNAGVGALYSLEHFRAAQQRLAPGGLFVAWLPLFQLAPRQVATIARTFLEVFPGAEGWMGNWSGHRPVLGLVGRKQSGSPASAETPPSPKFIEEKLQAAAAQEPALKETSGSLTRRALTSDLLNQWAHDAPLNTIDHPLIEYGAPRAMINAMIERNPIANQNLAILRRLLTQSQSVPVE
jgi:spermidine synthase